MYRTGYKATIAMCDEIIPRFQDDKQVKESLNALPWSGIQI